MDIKLDESHAERYMTTTEATFRQANSYDIPLMSAIRLAVRENILFDPSRITQQMYEDYLDLLGRGWVAEINGEIVGFSYADKINSSIWALFILPAHEGKGLAKQLLNLATGWLFDQGNDCVKLSTGAETRAARFYAMQGWTKQRVEGGDAFYHLYAAEKLQMSQSLG